MAYGVKSVLASPWSSQIAARNAAAAQARENQAEKRAQDRGETPPRQLSDFEMLTKDLAGFHEASTAAREEKTMRGVKVPRPLPNNFREQIDALPEGHEIRRARDEGRIRFDWTKGKGRWVVDGVAPAPAKEAVLGGDGRAHFPPGFFQGTARRERLSR